jgi:3-oxoacyl-[acyl-carrier protein] reductase
MAHYLIVGGTQGIGLAVTQSLIKQGHGVTIWARTAASIEGADLVVNDLTGDLLNVDGLPAVIDGLVYCPGSINLKPFARLSPADFLQDFQLNLVGAVKALQAVLPRLKQSPQASVVLFSTVAVALGMPYHASVAASKGAIEGMVKALAAEWAPAIRVNAVAPSLTQTPLAAKLLSSPEKIAAAASRHPLQTLGSPEDIAAMVVFLLGAEARWISGQILHVDGGMSSIKI